MPYMSDFIGRPVVDVDGIRIGQLKDFVVGLVAERPHPVVEALVVQHGKQTLMVAYSEVAALLRAAVPIKQRIEGLQPFNLREDQFLLLRDVLDKQIIDTEGARVVRVNDLQLIRVNGTLYVGNVDIGILGILRRLGLSEFTAKFARLLHIKLRENCISWNDVELLRSDQSMRLKVPVDKIAELHPADVAEIISDLNQIEGGQFLDALQIEHLADTLEEVEPEFQVRLVETMPNEKVADILEEMEPDEAADLLAEMPAERSEELLSLMEADDAADVRRLLAYPEDSAGGIMTTEFAVVPPGLTAEQAIQHLRKIEPEAETIFYVYVTDAANHLLGVFSLSGLIFAPPDTLVSDFMFKRVITVNLLEEQDEVAQVISKYDLIAVPVVDENNVLHGIVTADDALDKIIPTAWKKRLPRFYR